MLPAYSQFLFEETVFGLHKENNFREGEYAFGAFNNGHRIHVNRDRREIIAYKGDGDTDDGNIIPQTNELMDVLTKNKNIKQGRNLLVEKDTMENYLFLIDFCIGDELRNLAIESRKNPSQETKDLIQDFSNVHKFTDWIAPHYNIQTRWKPPRAKSFVVPGTGKGFVDETVVIPSEFKEQMKRMLLLLGASEAGNKDANLNEFTSILDTMRNNKKLSKKGYQILLQRFNS